MDYSQSVSANEQLDAPKNWVQTLADALSRIRYQLFGGILFAIIAPAVVRSQYERYGDALLSYEHSLIGTVCAVLLGYMVFRKMTVLTRRARGNQRDPGLHDILCSDRGFVLPNADRL